MGGGLGRGALNHPQLNRGLFPAIHVGDWIRCCVGISFGVRGCRGIVESFCRYRLVYKYIRQKKDGVCFYSFAFIENHILCPTLRNGSIEVL